MSVLDGLVRTVKNDSGVKTTGLKYGSSSNQMYDDLFKANPYVGLTYNKSPFQSILSSLGFRTDYDRWNEEAQVNAAEYDAQVASIMQQNDYNDPSSEASRLKAAGINPALTGLQGVESSASPIQDPQGMSPGSSESGEFGELTQKVWNFGTSILSLYQIGVGLSKDMLSFKQMKNVVEGQDVSLAKDFMSFADEYFRKNLPEAPFASDDEESNWKQRMSNWHFHIPDQLHFSRRQRRIWFNTMTDFFNSENFAKMTSGWKQSADNLTGYARSAHKHSRNGSGDEWKSFGIIADELGSFARTLYDMQQKNLQNVTEAGDAKAKYDKDFYDTVSGKTAGAAQNASARAQSAKAGYDRVYYNNLDALKQSGLQNDIAATQSMSLQIDKAMNSTIHKIVTNLSWRADQGDILAQGLLLAFNVFRISSLSIGGKSGPSAKFGF